MDTKIKLWAQKIFDNDLVTVHKIKTTSTLNKPAYIGMCLLELSKVAMYEFSYESIKGNIPVGTQRPEGVPWRSPKGPNVCDLQETNTKVDDLMKKVLFRWNSPGFTHLLLFFTGKTNI